MNKTIAYILNAVVVLFCVIAISCYFYSPMLDLKIGVKVTQEVADELKKAMTSEDASAPTQPGEVSENDVINETLDQLVKDEITLKANIAVTTSGLFTAMFDRAATKTSVRKAITDNVDGMLDTVSASIDKVVESLSKSMVKTSVKSALSDTVSQYIKDKNLADKTVDAVLTDLGLTDEFIDKKTETLTTALLADGATVDSVTATAMQLIDETVSTLASNATGDYADLNIEELSPEVKSRIETSVRDVLSKVADEDGNVDINSLVYNFIGRALDDSSKPDTGSGEGEKIAAVKTAIAADAASGTTGGESGTTGGATGGEEKQYTKEDVEKLLTERVESLFGEQAIDGVTTALAVGGWVTLLTMLLWLYLIVKIVIKLFAANPMIKLGLPIWLGNFPFATFFVLPFAASVALTKLGTDSSLSSALASVLPKELVDGIVKAGGAISLSVSSCAVISAILTVAFAAFSIFYMIFRNRLKEQV